MIACRVLFITFVTALSTTGVAVAQTPVPGFGNEFEARPVQGFGEEEKEHRGVAGVKDQGADAPRSRDQGADAPRSRDQGANAPRSPVDRSPAPRSPAHIRRPFTPAVTRSDLKAFRFRTAVELLPDGLPDWFEQKDANGDGQVSMAEFSREWNEQIVADFRRLDANDDGVLTPREVLPPGASTANERTTKRAATEPGGSSPRNSTRTVALVKIILLRYDRDGSGALEQPEWSELPWASEARKADLDHDGRLTVEELAARVQ
jgi:hypothetical protein